jgi:hypothetical protein
MGQCCVKVTMPPAKKSAKTARAVRKTPVSAVRHCDTRINITTQELRDFVAGDKKAPKSIG